MKRFLAEKIIYYAHVVLPEFHACQNQMAQENIWAGQNIKPVFTGNKPQTTV